MMLVATGDHGRDMIAGHQLVAIMIPLADLVCWLYLPPVLHGHTTHRAQLVATGDHDPAG